MQAPNRWHQRCVGKIFRRLADHADRTGLGEAYVAPFDVEFSSDDVVQPDVVYVAPDRLKILEDRGAVGAPTLVVEVLSDSSEARDRRAKRGLYAQHKVLESWIADTVAHTIEVLRLDRSAPDRVLKGDETLESPLLPGFTVKVAELF